MIDTLIRFGRKIIPAKFFATVQPLYHYLLALVGTLIYRFPSRKINVVAVTGTKGKTSTIELINSVLEEAGCKTALASTLRFKIGNHSEPNLYKMTTPGRFFMQRFLRRAVRESCEWIVIEMTSEAIKLYRHKFIDLDALIFTNIAPEHIESHGSYEKYLAAKLKLRGALNRSPKKNKAVITNVDDREGIKFLEVKNASHFPFSLEKAEPYETKSDGVLLTFLGKTISSPLRGIFNIYNILAAATFAKSQNIPVEIIKKGIEKVKVIKGRVEYINKGQNFTVIVDYAHTPDSLEALYKTFAPRSASGSISKKKLICVLGNTGGGRDKWKRPEMGKIADTYCDEIILTNEDPYDENPREILAGMEKGFSTHKPEIILDRREAISSALKLAREENTLNTPASEAEAGVSGTRNQNVVVLITGKGTDPYIMGQNGSKIPWDDATVVREELKKLTR